MPVDKCDTTTGRPSFRYFLLDMDGTIVDSLSDNIRSAQRMLTELGQDVLPDAQVASYFGHGIPNLVRRCLGSRADEHFDQAFELFMDLYLAEPTATTVVYDQAKQTMQEIADKGGTMAICTQTPEILTHAILDSLGLSGFFDAVIGPESVTNRKPHPEPLFAALKVLGGDPGQALFVGDSVSDMKAGKAAGVFTCAATYGYTDPANLLAERPDVSLGSFSELLAHVQVR